MAIGKTIDSCNGTRFRIQWKINNLFNEANTNLSPYAKSRTIARSTIPHLYTV